MPVHTDDRVAEVTMIGALAAEPAIQAAIDHAVEHGHLLQVIGSEFSSWELLATMRLVGVLAAGYGLSCWWELHPTRPIATASITDPESGAR